MHADKGRRAARDAAAPRGTWHEAPPKMAHAHPDTPTNRNHIKPVML